MYININDAGLYGREYFDRYYLKDAKRDAMYLQEYERIKAYFPHGGRVLDYGCGVGNFLSVFDDRWGKVGIEPSEFAAKQACGKGINIVSTIRILDTESFDVVVFRGTLQHINYPMDAIVHATRVLKKGGLLVFLATPDTDSLVYRIWGNLPALDASRNWIVFSGRVLANILKRLDYKDVKIVKPYMGTPYARPLSDYWQFIVSLFRGYRPFAFPGNMIEVYATK